MGPGPEAGAMNSSPGGFNQPKSAEASLGMDASGCAAPWASRLAPGAAPAQSRLAIIMLALVSFLGLIIGANANIERFSSFGTHRVHTTSDSPGKRGCRHRRIHRQDPRPVPLFS